MVYLLCVSQINNQGSIQGVLDNKKMRNQYIS